MPFDIAVDDLTVSYDSGGYTVKPLDGLSMTAGDGELVVLLGPSGCGKTTLLTCLGGMRRPDSGAIRIGSTRLDELDDTAIHTYRRERVGFMFQAFNLIPSLTAGENVAMPLLVTGTGRGAAMAAADRALARVAMEEFRDRRPGALSGGQQQRVAVARSLVTDAPLVLADEPTANLDYIQAESVIRLLREIAEPGRVVIVATHDDRFVPAADRIVELVPQYREDTGPPAPLELAAGTSVFEQGDRGELIYVIDEGEVDIVRLRSDGGEEHLATLDAGTYFGELGPLLGFPRSASARTRTDVRLTAYGAKDFRDQVLGESAPGHRDRRA